MLGRRVEVLKQKLQELEKEHQERLTAGEKTEEEADIACCDHSHLALERQRANLEEVAERKLTWSLRDKEREMQQELSYQVSGCVMYTATVAVGLLGGYVQVDRVHSEYESELREQLKRQADSHNQLLTDALNTQVQLLRGECFHHTLTVFLWTLCRPSSLTRSGLGSWNLS